MTSSIPSSAHDGEFVNVARRADRFVWADGPGLNIGKHTFLVVSPGITRVRLKRRGMLLPNIQIAVATRATAS